MATQSADQSTTLHIVFGGLCLLVRDEPLRMLHVLFPKMGHGKHHQAALLVHQDFMADSNPPMVVPLNATIRLPDQPNGTIAGSTLFSTVADEEWFGAKPVKRELLDGGLGDALKARITITAGRQSLVNNEGAEWQLGGRTRKVGTWVQWEIPGLPAGDIDFQCGTQTLRLRPKDRRIELVFLHERRLPTAPPLISQLPKSYNASPATPAEHFSAFYPLVGKQTGDPIPAHGKPKLSPNADASHQHEHAPDAAPHGPEGLDYTCIMATAPAERGP